jgi:ABC-type multidrug transport system ATPase subunit
MPDCFHAGLDARAAAIVMKAVKAVAASGHTVMVTIHQPSINIFESFDQLLLLQVRLHACAAAQLPAYTVM